MTKRSFTNRAIAFLKAAYWRRSQQRFFSQGTTQIQCGNFSIDVPKNHLLAHLLSKQPMRDQCIGRVAAQISKKYPESTFLDIGANVGDTAAIMATYASNRLILVEPSAYFLTFLTRNVAKFPNETLLVNAFVADGAPIAGELHHWAGTAALSGATQHARTIPTQPISQIATESTRFIKIDTDGFDFKIIAASIDWLQISHPALLFEDQIRNQTDLQSANQTFVSLEKIGYTFFIVWDDPGLHIVSTTSLATIQDLNGYLFQLWSHDTRRAIHNYDVLCLHNADADVFDAINAQCRAHVTLQS